MINADMLYFLNRAKTDVNALHTDKNNAPFRFVCAFNRAINFVISLPARSCDFLFKKSTISQNKPAKYEVKSITSQKLAEAIVSEMIQIILLKHLSNKQERHPQTQKNYDTLKQSYVSFLLNNPEKELIEKISSQLKQHTSYEKIIEKISSDPEALGKICHEIGNLQKCFKGASTKQTIPYYTLSSEEIIQCTSLKEDEKDTHGYLINLSGNFYHYLGPLKFEMISALIESIPYPPSEICIIGLFKKGIENACKALGGKEGKGYMIIKPSEHPTVWKEERNGKFKKISLLQSGSTPAAMTSNLKK